MLLKKLAIVRFNNTYMFRDIFDNFLDYAFFKEYLNTCYFQTLQMKATQSLNIYKRQNALQYGDTSTNDLVVEHTNTFLTKELISSVVS